MSATISYRFATIDDANELNAKLLSGWPDPFGGVAAWLFWHKDAVLNNNNSDVPIVAIDNTTGAIVGSCIGRIRDWSYGLITNPPYSVSEADAPVLDWSTYTDADKAHITAFMSQWEKCYESGAAVARQHVTHGRRYIHIRQMQVADN